MDRCKDHLDLRATRAEPYAGLQDWKLRGVFDNGETSTSVARSIPIRLTTGWRLRGECRCSKTLARFQSDLHRCSSFVHSSHMLTTPPASGASVSYRPARPALNRRSRILFALRARVSTSAAPPG